MEGLSGALAAGDGSPFALLARSALVGLRASLVDALDRYPGDDGAAAGKRLVAQIDDLLAATVNPDAAVDPDAAAGSRHGAEFQDAAPTLDAAPSGQAGIDHRWRGLIAAFAADPAVVARIEARSLAGLKAALDRSPQPPPDGLATGLATTWRSFQVCLLRLPPPLAGVWRDRAAGLLEPAPEPTWRVLPGAVDEVLVPPTRIAPEGLRTGADAEPDAEVLASLDSRPDGAADRADLAMLASAVLALSAVDDQLVLCLESVQFHGSRRLDDELQHRYRADLLSRLRQYARCPPGTMPALLALIEVDEALNSLTHRPPAALGSHWADLAQRSRALVLEQAAGLRATGADVEVLELVLRYRDVKKLTRGNDVAVSAGGEPGDVLRCLRVWARIDGRESPGRVMYRA